MFFRAGRDKTEEPSLAAEDARLWRESVEGFFFLEGLTEAEHRRLQGLAALFLREKKLDPVGGLRLERPMALQLAAQACLPLLHREWSWYDNWRTIILYPGEFLPDRWVADEAGVLHRPGPHSGEAWPNGPIILSWDDVAADLEDAADYPRNVAIHEICHQLDVRSGGFDGVPELPREVGRGEWIETFNRAFKVFRKRLDKGRDTWMDPYGEESPAEFFAVASETFFVDPWGLWEDFPEIYDLLTRYYRQDPKNRRPLEENVPEGGPPPGDEFSWD
ncbi:MAG: zinc-dependent peptidase [Magnetococcales bacterium]|nr:zinc-dependent peptidase [Magnetococcales bacterium]